MRQRDDYTRVCACAAWRVQSQTDFPPNLVELKGPPRCWLFKACARDAVRGWPERWRGQCSRFCACPVCGNKRVSCGSNCECAQRVLMSPRAMHMSHKSRSKKRGGCVVFVCADTSCHTQTRCSHSLGLRAVYVTAWRPGPTTRSSGVASSTQPRPRKMTCCACTQQRCPPWKWTCQRTSSRQ